MVARATAPARRRGLHIGWVLLAAAVVGTAVGVGLALKNRPDPDAELTESEALVARSLPLGAPVELALPDQSHDPYAADPRALEGIPPYPGASPRKLAAGSPLAQQTPMAIAWFETVDSVDAVVAFYEEAYSAAKLVYTSHRYSPRLGYVGFLDPPRNEDQDATDGMLHLVTAMQQGQRTVVLVSALQPLKLLDRIRGLPEGVVFPPRAAPVQLFDLSEGAANHQTLASRVKDTSIDDALAFYEDRLGHDGWSITEANTSRATRKSLSAARGATTQVVMIESRGTDVQVVVSYDKRAETRPGEPRR